MKIKKYRCRCDYSVLNKQLVGMF